jgi:hypothetical protein
LLLFTFFFFFFFLGVEYPMGLEIVEEEDDGT